MVVRVYRIEWGLMRMRGWGSWISCNDSNCVGLSLFWLFWNKPVRYNPSHCFGLRLVEPYASERMSSSKRPLGIRYRYMGNRRRAGFENPSNLFEVLQVVHWPLVSYSSFGHMIKFDHMLICSFFTGCQAFF